MFAQNFSSPFRILEKRRGLDLLLELVKSSTFLINERSKVHKRENGESAANACHRSKPGCRKLLRLALSNQSLTVAASEFFNATSRVDKLLFTSEKGMASGAYTDFDVATSRPGAVDGATSASDRRLYVIRMNICLHVVKK